MKYVILLLALVGGCATADRGGLASTQPSAKCLVCEKNYDLACIDVAVDAKTPRVEYGGKTYYFCSDECRDKFAKNPEKYLK